MNCYYHFPPAAETVRLCVGGAATWGWRPGSTWRNTLVACKVGHKMVEKCSTYFYPETSVNQLYSNNLFKIICTLRPPGWARRPPPGAVRGWIRRWPRRSPTWPTPSRRSCSGSGSATAAAENGTRGDYHQGYLNHQHSHTSPHQAFLQIRLQCPVSMSR